MQFPISTQICLILSTIAGSLGIAYAEEMPIINKNIEVDVKVDVPPQYGRSASEYFITPIAGLTYSDVTGITTSFFESNTREFSTNNNNNNTINVNRTEIGGVFGILFDGQYQIMATDYWRAGFQTGFIYTSPTEAEFTAEVCDIPDCSNQDIDPFFNENGTLSTSTYQIPILFTMSRYAAEDRYIATLKLGPSVIVEVYDLDFEGFKVKPESETQIGLTLGIDGRYRLGESDNFFLAGFLINGLFGNGNNNQFSGVDTVNNISVYLGLSFS